MTCGLGSSNLNVVGPCSPSLAKPLRAGLFDTNDLHALQRLGYNSYRQPEARNMENLVLKMIAPAGLILLAVAAGPATARIGTWIVPAAAGSMHSEWAGVAFIVYGIPLLVIGMGVGLCAAVFSHPKFGPGRAKTASVQPQDWLKCMERFEGY